MKERGRRTVEIKKRNQHVATGAGQGMKRARNWDFGIEASDANPEDLMAVSQDEPWLVGGDFNEIRFASEKKGGNRRPLWQMMEFQSVLDEMGLYASGPKFTWYGKRRGGESILEKLDRFVANEERNRLFPEAKAANQKFYGSDHRAVVIQLKSEPQKQEPRNSNRFFFENKWLLEKDYKNMVIDAWKTGREQVSLPEKIQKCCSHIQNWAKQHVDSIPKKIKDVSNKLEDSLNKEDRMQDEEEIK
ncbi:hypothetical protein ACS0TY_033824 [Phlomoides rotata]